MKQATRRRSASSRRSPPSCSTGCAAGRGDDAGPSRSRTRTSSRTAATRRTSQTIVDAFEKENPDITVEVTTLPYADYFTKLQTDLAAGTVGRRLRRRRTRNYAHVQANGVLAPLEGVDARRYRTVAARRLRDRRQAVRAADLVLRRRALLQQGPVRRGRASTTRRPTGRGPTRRPRPRSSPTRPPASGATTSRSATTSTTRCSRRTAGRSSTTTARRSPSTPRRASRPPQTGSSARPARRCRPIEQGQGTPDFDTNLFKDGKLAMCTPASGCSAPSATLPFSWDIAVEPGDTQQASAVFSNAVVVSATSKHVGGRAEVGRVPDLARRRWSTCASTPGGSCRRSPTRRSSRRTSRRTPPANRQAVFDSLDEHRAAAGRSPSARPRCRTSWARSSSRRGRSQDGRSEALDSAEERINAAHRRLTAPRVRGPRRLAAPRAHPHTSEGDPRMTTASARSTVHRARLARRAAASRSSSSLQDASRAPTPRARRSRPTRATRWFRDGAFIADGGVRRAAQVESASRFFDWCAGSSSRAARDRSPGSSPAAAAGTPVADATMLPARFTFAGEDGTDEWWDFQLDGYGTWLWARRRARRAARRCDSSRWRAAIDLDRRLPRSSSWERPCYDWWEEHAEQVHVSTLACIAAGLDAALRVGLVDDAAARRCDRGGRDIQRLHRRSRHRRRSPHQVARHRPRSTGASPPSIAPLGVVPAPRSTRPRHDRRARGAPRRRRRRAPLPRRHLLRRRPVAAAELLPRPRARRRGRPRPRARAAATGRPPPRPPSGDLPEQVGRAPARARHARRSGSTAGAPSRRRCCGATRCSCARSSSASSSTLGGRRR